MCNHLPPESRDENVIKLDHFNLLSLLQGSLTGEAAEKRVVEVRVGWGGGGVFCRHVKLSAAPLLRTLPVQLQIFLVRGSVEALQSV